MNMHGTFRAVMAGAALLTVAACTQDLNVPNTQNPDVARATATPGDVQSLAQSAARDWYVGSTEVDPWIMLNVTADVATMNYGNFGARFNNLQPRIPYNNNVASGDAEVAEDPWNNMYGSLGEANDVLRAIDAGVVLPGGTDKYRALALWARAGSLQLLAMVYDSAFAIDQNFDPTTTTAQLIGYKDMEAYTLAKLDTLIALTSTQSETYSKSDFPLEGGLTSAKMTRFANTMAAQLLTFTPRTAAEAATVDWTKVLAYADKGIGTGSAGAPFDFNVIGDYNTWWSDLVSYMDMPSWMMVDLKLIHQMSPNVPSQYAGTPTGCSSGDDACYDATYAPGAGHDLRLGVDVSSPDIDTDTAGTDFIYARVVQGDPRRGIYMQSPYYHVRHWSYTYDAPNPQVGPVPWTYAAGNDLIKAEALIRSGGDRNLAATLINNTRVTRGGLTPMTAANTDAEFMQAITYEREVELYASNGYGHFAMRHIDSLQTGTVRHLPLPAAELQTDGLPVYTYGGAVENPTGMNMVPGSAGHQLMLDLSHLQHGPFRTLALPDGQQMQMLVPKPIVRPSRSAIKQ
ncbi:MAG TPA: RagB/SusD family nutrient uptake outer membrane protein [Gemmatimonadaceae bacterium]|nr:RagB/SusD family nutrient uptake outer membrane protein [Gemmatimonadaceae bacterium]